MHAVLHIVSVTPEKNELTSSKAQGNTGGAQQAIIHIHAPNESVFGSTERRMFVVCTINFRFFTNSRQETEFASTVDCLGFLWWGLGGRNNCYKLVQAIHTEYTQPEHV